MKYKSVRGMEDILPEDIGFWRHFEDKARRDLESWGYSELRTPILESTEVFTRSIGESSDIVKKEMYTFKDKKERSLTLRPEGTAPIVRAYIEHALGKVSGESKLYYIGPMFRSERPQKGRTRQFHQIGVEVFGSKSPYADVEVIKQLSSMLRLLGLKDFVLKLNFLGCKTDKNNFASKLRSYLQDKENRLCENCKARINTNVLRVLDCKIDSCIQILRDAPNILDNLCGPCNDHYSRVKGILRKVGVGFEEAKNLVRGLDYYTGTVFEVTHPALGSQDAIGAGGRYDNLVKEMGGQDTGAIGYALGIERMIIAIRNEVSISESTNLIYVATFGDAGKIRGIEIAEEIRRCPELKPCIVLTDIKETSPKSQLRAADKRDASHVIIIGDDELSQDKVTLKYMKEKKDEKINRSDLISELKNVLGKA